VREFTCQVLSAAQALVHNLRVSSYHCHMDLYSCEYDRYQRFASFDGQFISNVVLQSKNGPFDFQVREPVHSLFGHMDRTNQMVEFEATQE
jgi:alpha-glucuronidase